MKMMNNPQRSVFVTLLVSYLSILGLAIIAGGIMFNIMADGLVDNAARSNSSMLEQVKLDIDSKTKEIWQLSDQIGQNPQVQLLLNRTTPNGTPYAYTYYKLSDELERLMTMSHFVDSFYIYFEGLNKIVTPNSASDPKTFFSNLLVYENKSYDQAINMLFSGGHRQFYHASERLRDNQEKSVITYVQSLPMWQTNDTTGYLVMLIDDRQIKSIVEKWEWLNQGQFFIMNDLGQVLTTTADNHDILKSLDVDSIIGDSYSSSFQHNGEEMMLLMTSSEQNGWKYLSIVPKKVIMEKVNGTLAWVVLILVLFLVAGIIVCYYMAYRNFAPIRRVASMIKNSDKLIDQKVRTNELDMINRTIMELFTEKKVLKSTINEQLPIIRSNFLNRLIKGQVNVNSLPNDAMERMGIHFQHSFFGVLIIDIDSCQYIDDRNKESELALIRFVIANIMDECFAGGGYTIELDQHRLVTLVSISDASEQSYEKMYAKIQNMKDMMHQRFKTDVTVSVSNLHLGLVEVGTCYTEASMAMEYKIMKESSQILLYEKVKNLKTRYYHYPLETEQQLLNYVKSGDYENVEQLLDRIFTDNLSYQKISPDMSRCLFIEVSSTVVKMVNTLELEQADLFDGETDLVSWVINCVTLDEMQHKVKNLYRNVCNHVNSGRSTHSDRLYLRLVAYIDEHCLNNTLSLTMIADHFELTSKYVSAFFKSHSGQNITDYLAGVRMKHAKTMLSQSKMTISLIAQEVGYVNETSFIRMFKKIEGITPGKYRENIVKQEK